MSMTFPSVRHGLVSLLIGVAFASGGALQLAQAEVMGTVSPRSVAGFEEPLVASAPALAADGTALAQALAALNPTRIEGLAPVERFIAQHPQSAWRLSLQTNLGLWYYREGYFSRAIAAWEDAWTIGQSLQDPSPQARATADRAVGELIRMHARLGHAERLKELLASVDGRQLIGPATELVAGAKQGLWMMDNNPGVAYLCGPNALRRLALLEKSSDPSSASASSHPGAPEMKLLERYQSGPQGVSLGQVAELAKAAKLAYRPAFRVGNTPIPVPSVVHWKVSHYAAIVGQDGDRYHIQDPTFGTDLWVSRDAIEREGTGFFMIPAATAAAGWRSVTVAEAAQVHGMGFTNSGDPNATRPDDPKEKPPCPNAGMCGYNAHSMNVSLNLTDTPVGYRPAVGPDVFFQLTYNQREARQPTLPTFGNMGPKWTSNWLAYVVDVPGRPGINTMSYVRGGGAYDETGYSANTGKFAHEPSGYSLLRLVSASPVRYERSFKDGSVEVYASPDTATVYPRRVFLTQVLDPQGNAVTLTYDTSMRVTKLTDAVGRITKLTYSNASFPLQVTKVTDPANRFASIVYDASGRLQKITDVLGLSSTMTYDAGSFITQLTTPYGSSTFTASESGPDRVLEMTDPLGYTERVESKQSAPGMAYSDPRGMPAGMDNDNQYLYYRNTFYWDKHAYSLAAGDYTKAKVQHWYHDMVNFSYSSSAMASSLSPLEGRQWFRTPNDSGLTSGTYNQPWQIGRVMDDGSTQLTTLLYNQTGNVASVTDPEGRYTQYTYGNGNGIDLTRVRVRDKSGNFYITAQYTYNSQHLPLTYTDAAGQVTQFAYNAAGQLTSRTNALSQVWGYTYNALGQLTTVTNPSGHTALSLTYDTAGRVATRTDSEGHVLGYAYDALDRITVVTYPDATTEQSTYDKLDLSTYTDRASRVTTYGYDANRNLTSVTDPLPRTVLIGHYRSGALLSITDGKNHVTTWQRDLQGRTTGKTYADGSSETFNWEAYGGRLASTVDGSGRTQAFTYRKDNLTASISYSGGSVSAPTAQFTYDSVFPRLKSMTDGTGTTQYQYGAVGTLGALQMTREDGPYANDDINYTYDALGRMVQRSIAGNVESVVYDALSRVQTGQNALGSLSYAYLGDSTQPTSQAVGTLAKTSYTYEANTGDRRLKSVTNLGTRAYQYTSDVRALITSIADKTTANAARSWTPGYDPVDRLTTTALSTGESFPYTLDAADNITAWKTPAGNVSASYDAGNQLTLLGGLTVLHDAAGNITDDGLRTYAWDSAGRMASIGYKSNAALKTEFKYDGLGRRIVIIETNGSTVTKTRYLWCGTSLCAARDSADVVTRLYFAEGEYRPSGATKSYYDRDQLGSVRNVTNVATGTSIGALDYDPYGNLLQSSGTPTATDFRFAGMFYHPTSGLYLTQYRAYSPYAARWMSRDPMGEAGGVNMYGYVAGDPLNLRDPDGRIPLPLITGAIGAVAGFGGSVIGQLISNGGNFGCISWKNAAIAGGVGAVAGALAPFAATSYLGAAGLGALSNTAQYGITQYANGDQMTWQGAGWNAVTGAIGGLIGGPISAPKGLLTDTSGAFIDKGLARALNQDAWASANTGTGNFLRNLGGSAAGNIDPPGSGGAGCGCK
jgi:RHS repeat-associated protein